MLNQYFQTWASLDEYKEDATGQIAHSSMLIDKVCGYGGVDVRCDCKFLGTGTNRGTGEATGCAENRLIARLCRTIIKLVDDLRSITGERDRLERELKTYQEKKDD